MNNIKKWNKINYQKFINYLKSLQDLKYKKFHSSLGINNEYLIGIPVPILKKIAKEISKDDYLSFIHYNTHQTYEEILIHGLILGYIKDDFAEILKMFNEFIPYIDNWALCDITVANLHIWHKNTKQGLSFVIECLNNKNEWSKRVGYVLLLNYYIKEEYLQQIFSLCDQNKTDYYYVKMAVAWLISICYIKYPKETLIYLKNNKLDNWTHNKAIQKIRESRRIDPPTKKYLNTLKRTS